MNWNEQSILDLFEHLFETLNLCTSADNRTSDRFFMDIFYFRFLRGDAFPCSKSVRMEMFEPYVTGLMWFDTLPDKKAIIDAFDLWTVEKPASARCVGYRLVIQLTC